MLSIALDLGNVPSILQALANERVAQDVVNAAAESYHTDTLDWIKAGRAFTRREGQLEQSIGWQPTGNGTAMIYANAEYAECVERGTRPHVINAKNGRLLKFFSRGGWVSKHSVNHPGFRPFPYFYTDLGSREQNMRDAGLLVIARVLNQ